MPHEAVRDVVRAVTADDLELLYSAFERLHEYLLWPDAMRALRQRRTRASPRMQREFLEIYSTFGIGISRQLLSDADAVGALRLLLPPYSGPAMQLYRGESAHNHWLRAYGLSWTTDRDHRLWPHAMVLAITTGRRRLAAGGHSQACHHLGASPAC